MASMTVDTHKKRIGCDLCVQSMESEFPSMGTIVLTVGGDLIYLNDVTPDTLDQLCAMIGAYSQDMRMQLLAQVSGKAS